MITNYYIAINIFTFLIWGFDKLRAIQHKWRVSEKMLITLIMVGGAFGGLAGMLLFRHKTRKLMFKIWIGLACVLHVFILFYYG